MWSAGKPRKWPPLLPAQNRLVSNAEKPLWIWYDDLRGTVKTVLRNADKRLLTGLFQSFRGVCRFHRTIVLEFWFSVKLYPRTEKLYQWRLPFLWYCVVIFATFSGVNPSHKCPQIACVTFWFIHRVCGQRRNIPINVNSGDDCRVIPTDLFVY